MHSCALSLAMAYLCLAFCKLPSSLKVSTTVSEIKSLLMKRVLEQIGLQIRTLSFFA